MVDSSMGSETSARETVDSMRARFTRTRTRPLASRTTPNQDPERIGRYRIVQRLGVGGMGVVYEAFDERVERAVALKLMLVGDAEVDRERLRREAQALARLSHPNVVEVFEIGEHHEPGSGQPARAYVAMELIDGHSLDRWLRLRRRTPAEVVAVFVQAGEGLAAAHAQGLVHRDFKPGNVLVGNDGRVRVVDFGLVRESDVVDPSASERSSADASLAERSSSNAGPNAGPNASLADGSASALAQIASWTESLTKTGAMVGTPAYMSPEQLTHLPVTPATDQFGFCVALHEALFRQHPFVVDRQWAKLPFNVLEGAINPPPPEPRVPARLVKVINRGLSVRPEHRWPSMDVLLAELRRALERRGARPVLAVVGLGVAVLGLAALANPTEANVPDRCEEASAIMGKAWGRQAREELRSAWMGTGRPSEADTWSRIDTRMQAYADDWWAVHRAACSGPTPSPSSATCLARLAEGAHTRLQVMASPNDSLLDNAVQMIGELPAVDRCRAALDEAPAEFVAEEAPPWANELDQVNALLKAGKSDDARALLDELLTRAGRESNLRLSAAAKLRAGYLHMNTGEVERSAAMFEESYLEAKHLGYDRLAAEAALGVLQLFGERYYREAEAMRWARHARAEAERIDDPALTSKVYNAWGRALRGADQLEEALALHEQALEIQRSLPSPDDGDIAISLFQIGTCLGLLERAEEGRAHLEEALRLQEKTFGPQHPRLGATLVNLGLFDMFAGKDDEALESLERSIAIAEALAPDNPMSNAAASINISHIHERAGRPLEAAAALQHHLDTIARAPEPESVGFVHLRWVEGKIALLKGELETARERFEQSIRAQESDPQPGAAALNASLGLAHTLFRLGRFEEAVVMQRRMLEEQKAKIGASPGLLVRHELVSSHGALAESLLALDRYDEALQELEQGRALLEGHGDADESSWLDVAIGGVLLEAGRPEDAKLRLQAAVEELGEHSPEEGLVQGLARLAETELALGEDAAALEHAQRAARLVEDVPGERPELRASVEFVLARSLGPSERARALALARRAQERWTAAGKHTARELERVGAWLAAHG
ncbi:serine/threonine-protein kinase [Paraliomyxa miuraensis]|uniref:serine/threonine-protein kinase n=1 Tax=Paraliomyxa miuraensis TaxID=376150 RepID=UPI00225AF3B7|nr:serine/threonine-protein kinase [Paraliomyxa miuraensis]MCX4241149.1 serine/threonine-protein kinase [Paraliomyxa miuraensis]